MLKLPSKCFYRSVKKHNVQLDTCADWLEGSVLFTDAPITTTEVIDILRETEIYDNQDFAWEFVTDVFLKLKHRGAVMGDNYPCEVRHGNRLVKKGDWQLYTPYAFCLALSLTALYPEWATSFGSNYTSQGELFENLTEEAIRAHYIGWTVKPTGWTRSTPKKLADVVSSVSSWLGEATGDLVPWTKASANEAGLDLLCFREYSDGRGGYPALLVQCASGNDWKKKLKAPDLRIWQKVITFQNDPKKAFSLPFALSRSEFQHNCNIVDGLLLDRYRLLAPGFEQPVWITGQTADKLRIWLTQRLDSLPQDTFDTM